MALLEAPATSLASSSKEGLKRLNAARGQCKGIITKMQSFVSSEEVKYLDTESIKVKRNRLLKAFADYESYNIEIKTLDPESDSENFDEIDDKYCAVLAKLNALLDALHPDPSASSTPTRDLSTSMHKNEAKFQRLPRINIKPFSGETSEYMPFINMFNSVVHNNDSLNSCDKLYYLTTYLCGEALDVIKHLPLTPDNYTIALNLLKQRFHNKVKIISHHVNAILDMAALKKPNAVGFRSIATHVKQHLGALQNLQQPISQWDTLLVCVLQKKLDFYSLRAFYTERHNTNDMPSLEELLSFIDNRAVALETATFQKEGLYETKERKYTPTCGTAASVMKISKKPVQCKFCNLSHRLYSCTKFKLAASKDRNDFISLNKICKLCLNDHSGNCKYNFKCQVCKGAHNTLLHRDSDEHTSTNRTSAQPVALYCNSKTEILLPTAQVLVKCKDGTELAARALLDSGSQVSLISADLLTKVCAKTYKENNSVLGICEGINNFNEKAELTISSRLNRFKLNIVCCVVNKITCDLPQFKVDKQKLNLSNVLALADQNFHLSAPIDILLGCNEFFQLVQGPPLLLEDSGPYLLKTHFGDVITGSIPHQYVIPSTVSNSTTVSNHVSLKIVDNSLANINENIAKFWTAEKVPEIYSEKCSEHELAESIFKQSVTLENNRFAVALPLKQPINEISLGNSFSAALQRFHNLESRLSKDSQLHQVYKDFINEYIKLGHAEPYDISNYDIERDVVFFLPHHPVFNENSPTTKMRAVFDGSLQTKNKISLNDVLLNGPVVQNELFDILILFRLPRYILLCDVKQMFRQILIHPQYRVLQNILWRESLNDEVSCLQLKTVTYGLKSSSYLATRCLIELAERFKEKYSLASSVLKSQSYVDDIITGDDDIQTLIEIKRQLVELLSLGGFQLHKWGSNNVSVMENVSSLDSPINDVDMSKDDNFIKTLGLRYNVRSDNLYISCSETEIQEKYTKRQALSFISKVFDPLGLCGPVVMSAKLLMQSIYLSKVLWDEELPRDLNERWLGFAKGLVEMSSIQTKRHIDVKGAKQVELVGFADASNKAYGCCLYIRAIQADDTVSVNLLCSKSRANSTNNELSTPRKELNSALLLSMLVKRVHNTLKMQGYNLKVYLYLDSQIVLAWLNIEPVKLMSYVANRVIKIKSHVHDWPWFYVRSADNPADCLSKGLEPQSLQNHELWWHGPQFLTEKHFVHETAKLETLNLQKLPELKKHCQNNVNCYQVSNAVTLPIEESDLFCQYSDINKLKRIVAYIMRFATNSRTKANRRSGELQPDELDIALHTIVKCDQQRHYACEIACLKSNKPIKGPLAPLNPFLDSSEILRVGGRLQHSELSYEQKHPMILVKSSHITKIIIWKEHENLLHAGPKLLLSALNQRFWLINAVSQIKHVIHKCLRCFRLKAKAASQLMGSLPAQRVRMSRPFEKVGIDYAGYFNIKLARVRKPLILKAYILIFVCFVTKAIHVELASDLTTGTFLNCFKRFIARRNKPSQVFCDNAATFKGANSKLHDLYKLQSSTYHQSAVTRFSADQGISFHFTPAYSPVFGGLWEAGVHSVKYHLKRVIGNTVLTYEEFNTVIIQIEGILNARPLTPMSTDPTDMSYLTPSHFLTGAPITCYPEPDLTNIPTNRLSFWNQCSQLQQHFFKQWHKSYLSMLQNRPKWRKESPNVKEGMLVILKDANVTPFNWPIGRIVSIYPGKDNRVRAFDVKTPNGNIVRTSITKVCILPINE